MAGRQDTDDLAKSDRLSGVDGSGDRFVGRPQSASVIDADHAPPGQGSGEHDRTRRAGPDRLVHRPGQVDAAVPG